jgi:hypothetical protein
MTSVDPKLDVDAFIRAARAPAPFSEDGKQAVRARLQATLGAVASPWARATASRQPPDVTAGGYGIRLGWKAPLLVAAGFGLGLAAHAAMDAAAARHSALEPAMANAVSASLPSAAPSSLPSQVEAVLPVESLRVVPSPPSPPSPRSDTPAPRSEPHAEGAGGDLASEELLLETARTALERRDPTHALEALERHAQRFPRGQLREERESLRIGALVAAGRTSEARARTVEFHRAFPESLQGVALDALLESAP